MNRSWARIVSLSNQPTGNLVVNDTVSAILFYFVLPSTKFCYEVVIIMHPGKSVDNGVPFPCQDKRRFGYILCSEIYDTRSTYFTFSFFSSFEHSDIRLHYFVMLMKHIRYFVYCLPYAGHIHFVFRIALTDCVCD